MSLSVKSESFKVDGKLRYQFFEDDGSIAGGNAISFVHSGNNTLPTVNFMNHTGTISVNLPNGVNSAIVKISPAKPGPYTESVWFDNILITKEESMPIVSYFAPNVVSSTEYWPFGYPMKAASPQEYRFGFNGMEKDPEITGQEGSHYTTTFRAYDSRIGRWWSIDPLFSYFPWQSPYVAFDNNPILIKDPKGLAGEGWEIKTIQERARESEVVINSETQIGLSNFIVVKADADCSAQTLTRSDPIVIEINQNLDEAVLAYAYELKNAENASRANVLLDKVGEFEKEEWISGILHIEAEAIIQEAQVGSDLGIETGFGETVVAPALEEYFNSEMTEGDYQLAVDEIAKNLGSAQATETQTAEEYYGEMYDNLTEDKENTNSAE